MSQGLIVKQPGTTQPVRLNSKAAKCVTTN